MKSNLQKSKTIPVKTTMTDSRCVSIIGELLEYERVRMTVDNMVADLECVVEDCETSSCREGDESLLALVAKHSEYAIPAAERILKTRGCTKLSFREIDALKFCLSWYSTNIGHEETSSLAIQKRIYDAIQSITRSEEMFLREKV